MRISKTLLFIFIFLFAIQSFAQTTIRRVVGEPRTEEINYKIYNVLTGEKVTMEELAEIVKDNPRPKIVKEYNRYGKVGIAYYYPDAKPGSNIIKMNPEDQPQIGEKFPEFTFTTAENEEFAIEDLRQKWILIHFDLGTDNINENRWLEISDQIYELQSEGLQIETFALNDSSEDLSEIFSNFHQSIHLVPNSFGFIRLFNVTTFPSAFLLDPSGTLVMKLEGSDFEFKTFIDQNK